MKKLKLIFVGIIFLCLPGLVSAAALGGKVKFFIDPNFDSTKREETIAQLIGISPRLYFYIDDSWWNSKNVYEQADIGNAINFLTAEFENKIYPTLTSNFGSEWKPGIDKDERITILIHPLAEEAAGYFNSGDEYSKLENPKSNEREMIYLNSQHLDKALLKSFLAHEFVHLITFNQKDKTYGVSEETWLNEARAEYVPTLVGYDEEFGGSNLQRRVKQFLEEPSNSITEWQNTSADYGSLNLFTQYLVDHYGVKILIDSLHSSKIGIPSINEALVKNGFQEDFSQIFTNWTITVLVNNCSLNEKYCYKNKNLKNFRLAPQTIFLPLIGESTLSIINTTKNWTGNWHKIIGGKNILKLEFQGDPKVKFRVPYLIEDLEGKTTINFLNLDKDQKATIFIPDFKTKNNALTIIPSVQSKLSSFNGLEPPIQFSFVVSIVERTPEQEQELIKKLLEQIDFLQKEIARVQAQINAILAKKIGTCTFSSDLYFGMMGNPDVRCLQEFLESQGSEIYPEGLVTGNFLSLTQKSVIRFQEKYATEILVPLGLEKGTGYFGPMTRAVANQKLNW